MTVRIIRPLTGPMQVLALQAPRGDEPANKTRFKDPAGAASRPTWVNAADERRTLAYPDFLNDEIKTAGKGKGKEKRLWNSEKAVTFGLAMPLRHGSPGR